MRTTLTMRSEDSDLSRTLVLHASRFKDEGRERTSLLAFSLVEIIIAVGLMSLIMLGLLLAFNQTQRAFRTGMTQADVLEGGRAVTSLIARELEQIRPSYGSSGNFFSGIPSSGTLMLQPLVGGGAMRTNFIHDLFFLTRENRTWMGIGYFVRVEEGGRLYWPETVAGSGQLVGGRLYRFEEKLPVSNGDAPNQIITNFFASAGTDVLPGTNTAQVVDGVVHFKVRAFDTNGVWIVGRTNNIFVDLVGGWGEVKAYNFTSNAVPVSVEFELGLVEDRIWERYKSIPDANARYDYLVNQAGRVHLFRQRVAVRNIDPTAYQ